MRDPGQIAFCRVRKIIEDMFGKFSTYDTVLPEVGTSYPFFYIGESFQNDELSVSYTHLTLPTTSRV